MLTGKKLGEAIEKARLLKGVTKAELSRQFDVEPPSIQGWVKNGRIGKDKLEQVVRYFSDTVDASHWGSEEDSIFSSAPQASRNSRGDLTIAQYDTGGSMGSGRLILDGGQPGIIKSWRVDQEWLRLNVKHYTNVANLCIVTGFGSSMMPKYNPGDPLLMDCGIKSMADDSDGIYFFRLQEYGYIKQLQRIPTEKGTIVEATSYNRDYKPFTITKKMQSEFEIFGKILTIWKSEQV
jgi:hypothetical protein